MMLLLFIDNLKFFIKSNDGRLLFVLGPKLNKKLSQRIEPNTFHKKKFPCFFAYAEQVAPNQEKIIRQEENLNLIYIDDRIVPTSPPPEIGPGSIFIMTCAVIMLVILAVVFIKYYFFTLGVGDFLFGS